jgi:hypothetical protein
MTPQKCRIPGWVLEGVGTNCYGELEQEFEAELDHGP